MKTFLVSYTYTLPRFDTTRYRIFSDTVVNLEHPYVLNTAGYAIIVQQIQKVIHPTQSDLAILNIIPFVS